MSLRASAITMILKVFGLLDLYSALVMILAQNGVVSWRLMLTATAWLVLKGFLFRGDLISSIDLGIGVYFLFMFIFPVAIISYVLATYLIIKGLQSVIL